MKVDEALTMAKQTREGLPNEKIVLPAVLQNCKTICRYLDRLENNKWIDYELNGYPSSFVSAEEGKDRIPKYRIVYQAFYDEAKRPIRIDRSDFATTIGETPLKNSIVELLQYKKNGMAITSSPSLDMLNSREFREEYKIPDNAPRVMYGQVTDGQIARLINGVQDKIYEFLDNIVLELEYGKIPEAIFETLRKEVDEKFMRLCPVAIQKLIFIYEELNSNNNIVYSQIAGTCRQIIKDVADRLYPSSLQSNNTDSGMELTDDRYLNRLSVVIGSNREKNLFKSMFKYTTQFLHEINSYASKGDHNQFQKSDAVRCVVYTYMLLGDILHYYANDNITTK